MSNGHYGYIGPDFLGPSNLSHVASASVTGSTAMYVVGPSDQPDYRVDPGYHISQQAPVSYITLPPHVSTPHHAPVLEVVTLDGGVIAASLLAASLAAYRRMS